MLTKRALLVMALLCAGVFAFGVMRLFSMRLQAGDVYALYSSLRADPLGSKVLYEAIISLPDREAGRNFSSRMSRIDADENTTLLLLGIRRFSSGTSDDLNDITQMLSKGARVVLTLQGTTQGDAQHEQKKKPKKNEKKKEQRKQVESDDESEVRFLRWHKMMHEWGAAIALRPLDSTASEAILAATELPLERFLPWRSTAYLDDLSPEWRAIYTLEDRPVVAERAVAKGTLVIATDSYFVSNEAMLMSRQTHLLAWLLGANRRIIFDETHLGSVESPGIASLARKYNLHGAVLALLVAAALFVWKTAARFLPPLDHDAASGSVLVGFDSRETLVNLLRRGIPERDLLSICFAEWKKSPVFGHTLPCPIKEIEAVVETEKSARPHQRRPVSSYRKICRMLAQQQR